MLVSALLVGLLVGFVRGGRLQRLAELRPRWWPLFLLAIILRVAASFVLGDGAQWFYTSSLWILALVALRNVALPGGWFMFAGVAANALVVSLNNGAMPVSRDAVQLAGSRFSADHLHQVVDAPPVLGDVIPVPVLGVYSLGDVLLAAGVFVLIVWTMKAL